MLFDACLVVVMVGLWPEEKGLSYLVFVGNDPPPQAGNIFGVPWWLWLEVEWGAVNDMALFAFW